MSEITETEIYKMTKEQNYMRGYVDGKADAIESVEEIMLELYNKQNSRGKHYCEEYMRDVIKQLKEQK